MQINDKIEIAILQEDINKYYPGAAKFILQSFSMVTDTNAMTNRLNSMNKNKTFSTGSISISQTITLFVPKHVTLQYKSKIIPKGTKFIVAFAGDDNTKPMVIGLKVDGE